MRANSKTFNESIRQLAVKYHLTRAEVVTVLERLFASMLGKWYGGEAMVLLSEHEGLTATVYRRSNGDIRQIPVEPLMLQRFMAGKTPDVLHRALERFQVVKETGHLQCLKHHFCWGEVIGFGPNGDLNVELEIGPDEKIIAECPRNRLGLHERQLIRPGQRRAWHLRSAKPVLLNGTPRIKVVVDRVSKNLTAGLLRAETGFTGIKCTKRYVGRKSFIESPARLPREAIMAVKHELKEHIQVDIVKQNKRGSACHAKAM